MPTLTKPKDYSIEPDRPYSLSEVATKLACSADTVRRLVEAKKLKSFRVNTLVRIKGQEILAYIKSSENAG